MNRKPNNNRFIIIIHPDFLAATPKPDRFVADPNETWDGSWLTQAVNNAKTFATQNRANKWISDRGITYKYEVVPA